MHALKSKRLLDIFLEFQGEGARTAEMNLSMMRYITHSNQEGYSLVSKQQSNFLFQSSCFQYVTPLRAQAYTYLPRSKFHYVHWDLLPGERV